MVPTPKGGADRGTAPAAEPLVSIGTVLGRLREEFPEVTVSKIRFLEAEGLVEPRRTPSGYRKFSEQDVERLALVLRMQRDHYLPLKVIKEHLEAEVRGERPAPPGPPRDRGEAWPAPQDLADERPGTRCGRAELLAALDVGEDELAEWESYGLVAAASDGSYDADAVAVARLVAALGRFGLEPRHLRVMKAAAEREAGLVEQVVAPLLRHRNPQTRAHAEATTRELAGLSTRLHAALVRASLSGRFR